MNITVVGSVSITTQSNKAAMEAAAELRELLHVWRYKYQRGSSVFSLVVNTSGDE